MKFQHLGEAMRYLVTEHSASILTKKTFLSMLYDIVPERADEIQLIAFVMNGSIVNSLLQQDPKTKDTRSAALATMTQRMIDERHLQPETARQIANYYAYALGWETATYASNSSAPAKRSSDPPDGASPVPAGRYGTPKIKKQILPVVLILFLLLAGLITLILLARKQPKPLEPAIDTLVVPVTEETTPPTEATIPETNPIETAAPTALVTQPVTEAPIPTEPPTTEPPVTEPPVTEKAVAAFPGQAYLAIANSNFSVEYWGESDDPLAYNAGVVDITGNGSYVVSVTTDTNAFRNNEGQYYTNNNMAEGIGYMAVNIENGDAICPGATITIDSILVDGIEIKLLAKNFTDYGVDNIEGVIYGSGYTGSAWCPEGSQWEIEDFKSIYPTKIINPVYFEEWSTVEVHFTVSGMDS